MRRLVPLLLLLPSCAAVSGSDPPPHAVVERVVDGDTLVARMDGRRERVRLIGIDTPESVRPGTPVECFARAAADALRSLVEGEEVELVADVERRDRYRRLLAYVYRSRDGLFVNRELVARGYATVYTVPPNVRYARELLAAERDARRRDLGLWGACSPRD